MCATEEDTALRIPDHPLIHNAMQLLMILAMRFRGTIDHSDPALHTPSSSSTPTTSVRRS
jgi:hypothetical protein